MTFIPRRKLYSILVASGMVLSVHFLASSLETLIFGNLIHTAGADGEGGTENGTLAVADSRGLSCAAAKRRALEIAPELLALASWPLDDHEPAECSRDPQIASVNGAAETPDVADVAVPTEVVASVSGDRRSHEKKAAISSPETDQRTYQFSQQLAAVDTAALDEIRGGFELEGGGLKFSIGIERAVFINGNLVATNVLNVKDIQSTIARSTLAEARGTGATTGALVVQNGPGNYAPASSQVAQTTPAQQAPASASTQSSTLAQAPAPAAIQNPSVVLSQSAAPIVIQNSLDGQRIQAVTTVNASVNSLQAVRAMSVHNAIQTGIVGSLRR